MDNDPIHEPESEVILAELVDAGYVEEYTGRDGQPAMRLTASGEHVARQLATVAEEDAASMMAVLADDDVRSADSGQE